MSLTDQRKEKYRFLATIHNNQQTEKRTVGRIMKSEQMRATSCWLRGTVDHF